jgi:hypothetical protein
MRSSKPPAAPPGAGAVYLVLVLIGIVLGLLCGAEQIPLIALIAFGGGGIAVFLAWSIWRLDPAYLLRSEHYRDEPSDPSESRRDS